MIPVDDPRVPIFASKNYKTCDTLCVILHGAGSVRAGQWARSLCINESLKEGSQLEYVKKAHALGWGVVLLNFNIVTGADAKPLKRLHSNYSHFEYVWDELLAKLPFKRMVIIAHSYGGCVTVNLLNTRPAVAERLVGIAFTDSVHNTTLFAKQSDTARLLNELAVNWVTSKKPRDRLVSAKKAGVRCLSAGHNVSALCDHAVY
jgi:pimeloyl-ACP methyl ester carboxylesterase